MLLLALIVTMIVSIVVWTAIDAPNINPPSPPRRRKDLWG
jgi:hypothetical protein